MVELIAGCHFDVAIRELSGFGRVWLVWWFHRNQSWRPQVLPPRGRSGRKGVLSTRSPHRPNPIGISAVPLLEVKKNRLLIGPHDLLDGTPILDVKPYVPCYDAFPDEPSGWLDSLPEGPALSFALSVSSLASEQLAWLTRHDHPQLGLKIDSVLRADPRPHRTRRITSLGEQRYVLKTGSWRVFYELNEQIITIERVSSRYELASVFEAESSESRLHASFHAAFPGP